MITIKFIFHKKINTIDLDYIKRTDISDQK